jgi:hypothetical protein
MLRKISPQDNECGSVTMPLRAPKIDREWRTTIILVGVIAFLSAAVAIEVAARYF